MLRFVLYRDPDTGVDKAIRTGPRAALLFPFVAATMALIIVSVLVRRETETRLGFAAWRERPVVMSLVVLVWASAPPGGTLLMLLLADRLRDVPAGSHLSNWVLADQHSPGSPDPAAVPRRMRG
jgi:hypothetical protein